MKTRTSVTRGSRPSLCVGRNLGGRDLSTNILFKCTKESNRKREGRSSRSDSGYQVRKSRVPQTWCKTSKGLVVEEANRTSKKKDVTETV